MKAASVQASTMFKHGRMDPGYYLGLVDGEDADEKVARAEKAVKQAQSRLRTAKAKRREARARTARLIREGEVSPLN